MPTATTIFTTDCPVTAARCGYDRPTSHDDGGLQVTFETHPGVGPCFTLNGPDGEIQITGEVEARMVAEAILAALRVSAVSYEFRKASAAQVKAA